MIGQKPNAFLVAAIYIVTVSLLSALIYALSGYDRLLHYIQLILPVNPYPTYEDLEAWIPTVTPMAGILMMTILMSRLVIDVGYMGYCLKLVRREETYIKTIFESFTFFIKIIWLELLKFVRIFLWSFLLILPGIMAYYRYRQALYILLDSPNKRALDCIRESKHLMVGHSADLFMLDLSFFGWRVLDVITKIYTTIPLLSIWLAPYAGVTYASFYQQLVSNGKEHKDVQ